MTRATFPLLVLPLGLALLGSLNTARASAYLDDNGVFTTINLGFSYSYSPVPSGINDSGQVVGSTSAVAGFLYTNGSVISVAEPGNASVVTGIDDAGQVLRQRHQRCGRDCGDLHSIPGTPGTFFASPGRRRPRWDCHN
jgi:hypothetical protein